MMNKVRREARPERSGRAFASMCSLWRWRSAVDHGESDLLLGLRDPAHALSWRWGLDWPGLAWRSYFPN
jgi:hypothetical protein